jgi:hypothetical protein
LNIVYYTSGISGSGRVVRGISIGNGLNRNNIRCNYTILSSSKFAHLADRLGIAHREIPAEDEHQLDPHNFHNSALYTTLVALQPDVLIIDLLWFNLYHFIEELSCKKIFICHQVYDRFFSIPLESGTISIRPEDYDLLLAVEPFHSSIPMEHIEPIILRNRNEILPRHKAIELLNLKPEQRNCLFAFNAHPGDFDRYKKKYNYLEDGGYQMVYTTNYRGGIFPIVDYFNAFDFIVTGAGYSAFWEVIYFDKEAVFENFPLMFSSTVRRLQECSDYRFTENGADQLAKIIETL